MSQVAQAPGGAQHLGLLLISAISGGLRDVPSVLSQHHPEDSLPALLVLRSFHLGETLPLGSCFLHIDDSLLASCVKFPPVFAGLELGLAGQESCPS